MRIFSKPYALLRVTLYSVIPSFQAMTTSDIFSFKTLYSKITDQNQNEGLAYIKSLAQLCFIVLAPIIFGARFIFVVGAQE